MSKPCHIEGQRPGPRVVISAGVHGDEYEPVLAALDLIRLLPGILVAGSVTIVPVVNTSAYLTGSRYGQDGLDLARICPGKADGSDSEIAAAQISSLIQWADYYIDLHTGGDLFEIFPLAGYMLHSSAAILERQQAMAKAFHLPVIWGTDKAPNGRTLSVARDALVPAIYIEFGGGGAVKKEIADACVRGCINVLASLGMTETAASSGSSEPPGSPGTPGSPASPGAEPDLPYWVEDYTPDGGYLQGKMPAPAEGIFVPAVELGAVVRKDQLWGTVIRPLENDRHEVRADKDGIVLFLRRAPFVRSGEALGGILPITDPGKLIIDGK